MLTSPVQRGVGLIEVMVAVVIMAIIMAVAAPNFGPWIAGARIRATAESLLAGLQYAKSEATTRNTRVRFQLTTSLGADCVRDARAANWVVDVVDADADADSVVNQCNSAPSDTVAPSILQIRAASEAGGNVQVVSDSDEVVFNGLGRQVPLGGAAAAANINIEITPSGGGTCAAAGGKVTCLRVAISPAGQVRMCNPSIAAGDPQAC
ncbi:GspH/FimT family pseudopilin [Roseateles asaccharophilus]|uniref:Type II secretion system protein H n=1 Tax=Roseateles asaccharophilus TaxID=582607 RepID=A0ABU2A1M0_9BURK|nr:GspH/FimT family pseudopilin [Roseateles asaccharophilus]MDR7331074.1 type IV fimbrial biogenesis protein FimT [Roseateles asaccharophilus]